MGTSQQPDFDEEFDAAVADWRDKYRLREDDAVMLLIQLFRIHQQHWDEIRRRELPTFEQFRSDIAKLVEAAREIQQHAGTFREVIQMNPVNQRATRVTRAAAVLAALAAMLCGYLIGRAWP